jgi:type VI secretion system FHA domain protein
MLNLTLVGAAAGQPGAGLRTEVQVTSGQASFTIGRDPACDWVLPDRTLAVSARHCEIVRSGQGVVLRDHSTNGTFVNGADDRMPAEQVLRHGDRIEVGPFVIEVRMSARPGGDAALPVPVPARATRTAAVDDTAPLSLRPLRGGDPAAAAAAALPPAEPDLTRIRPAPPAVPRDRPRNAPLASAVPAADSPPPQPPIGRAATSSAHAALPGETPEGLLRALADALGLPAQALVGRDPVELMAQLGALTRSAVQTLQQLQASQARAQRDIGSRRLADWRTGAALRLAGETDDALLALLDEGGLDAVKQVAQSLAAHHDRLVSAPRTALRRLGDDLAPGRLASGLPASDPARQWRLYGRLWQQPGAGDDSAWSDGLVSAGWLHLAAAYDQDPPEPDDAP